MASSSVTPATHILVIPFPGQGHIAPLLDLTHHLLLHSATAITATVVVTPKNLPFLQPLLSRHPSTAVSALVLPFPSHPSLPAGSENNGDIPPSSFDFIVPALNGLRAPLLKWFTSHSTPHSVIISDMFLGWTHQLAEQLSIKRIVFSPSGAFSLSILLSLFQNLPPFPNTENDVVLIINAPGQPEFSYWQLSSLYKAFESSDDSNPHPMKTNLIDNISSWGFIINTFSSLESVYIDHLKNLLGHHRIWTVGPLFLPGDNESEVFSWLDTCADAEVVYVSFGSWGMLSQKQVDVLALGLEKSGIKFVWKFNKPSSVHVDGHDFGQLPPGFVDRVAGRGLVITHWAPQVLILKHRAVGSFLTHCGWNSILEGLDAGVMFLMRPLGMDQFWNARLIVEILKVGVGVGQGTRLHPSADELAKVLRETVSQSGYKEEKARAMQFGKEGVQAMSEDGSSFSDLEMLVQDLIQLPKLYRVENKY